MRKDEASMGRMLMTYLCVGAMALALATTANAVALTNPGFEDNPPLNGWTTFNFVFGLGTGAGVSGAMASGSPHGGLNVMQAYGPFTGGWDASGAYQDIAVTEGMTVTLTGYGMNPSGDAMAPAGSGFGIIQIAWNGGALGTVDSSQIDKAAGVQDTWQALSAAGVAPAGTTYVRLLALHVNGPDFSGGSAYFDDLAVNVVPEPSSIALVLSGLLGLGIVSRKRRA